MTNPRVRFGASSTVSPDRGMRRHTGEHELVRTEAQHRPGGVVGRRRDEPVDQRVARPAHPGGAVDELGDEPSIHVGQARRGEHRPEHEVGVGTIGLDPPERVERDAPSRTFAAGTRSIGVQRVVVRGRAGSAGHREPNSSSGLGRAPLRQDSKLIAAFPSGCTIVGTSDAVDRAGPR